jgi:hypothetical protein
MVCILGGQHWGFLKEGVKNGACLLTRQLLYCLHTYSLWVLQYGTANASGAGICFDLKTGLYTQKWCKRVKMVKRMFEGAHWVGLWGLRIIRYELYSKMFSGKGGDYLGTVAIQPLTALTHLFVPFINTIS